MKGWILYAVCLLLTGCINFSEINPNGGAGVEGPCDSYEVTGYYTLTKVLYRDKDEGEFYYAGYNSPDVFDGYMTLGEKSYEIKFKFSMVIDTFRDTLEIDIEKRGNYAIEWTDDKTVGSLTMSPLVSDYWSISVTRCRSLTFYINDTSEADYYMILKWVQF